MSITISEVKWGIIGCANIARKNIRAIQLSCGNKLRAVASRNLLTAQKFIEENCLEGKDVLAYGTYEELLADSEIDAVYIPLPTTMHLEWVKKTAEAGKHVLLEKPTAVNLDTLKLIIEACNDNGVIFMDAVMFMHHSRIKLLRNLLSDPFTGTVSRVNCSFCFKSDEDFFKSNIRTQLSGDPLGCLGDLGWYCIRIGIIAFSNGNDLTTYGNGIYEAPSKLGLIPKKCSARCNSWTSEGVPLDVEAIIWFGYLDGEDESTADDRTKYLRFDSSFLQPFRQAYTISVASKMKGTGDKIIRCNDFVLSDSQASAQLEVESHPNGIGLGLPLINHATITSKSVETFTTGSCVQEAEMFTTFASYLLRSDDVIKDRPSLNYWKQISLWNQACIDACLKSMKNNGAEVAIPWY